MVSKKDRQIIKNISEKYNANKVILFGSSLNSKRNNHNDIDIAVAGVSDKDFFNYYGDLLIALSKPVDIIDLNSTLKFVEIIKKEGKVIYARL